MSSKSLFVKDFIWTGIGLLGAFFLGYFVNHSVAAGLEALFIAVVLILLEVSISFDNAVVNATVLRNMTPKWRHRFLTWGMWIAVFGMRLIFPLVIVSVVASLNPWEALKIAALEPARYAEIMLSVHHEVAAFGGSFLMLVALQFFFNEGKAIHWIRRIEEPLVNLGRLEAVEVGVVLVILYAISKQVDPHESLAVLGAGIAGILTFLVVEGVGTLLKVPQGAVKDLEKASAGMFLYLEVLDASFSFDGVVGAFAITNNLFIIAIGLGIGALFVRSMTILLVDKGTLSNFMYLEHGAFYAVGALALIMFIGILNPVPEIITGAIGLILIGLAFYSSRRENKRNPGGAKAHH